MSVTKTEAIKAFLTARSNPDLADLYTYDMEVQITVAKGKGERIEGDYKGRQWQAYTDGFQTWKPIRIPVNANTKPEYTDNAMQYDLSDHAEGIGMTGWDWKNLTSKWVAFDFDAITGHSEKHSKKLSETELDQIRTAVSEVPYVALRKSTGGKGLHIYVHLEPTRTENHNEHAAVARAILSQLSGVAGFDFSTKVDICVPAETWTLTAEGPRQVRDLIGKSCTLIVDGRGYSSEGFFRTRREMVYELETKEGYKVQATGDHKFLACYDFGNSDHRYGNQSIDLHQELLLLKPGDKVYLNNHQDVAWEGQGTYEEGYLCGLLYGDGTSHKNRDSGRLHFFPDDYGLIPFAQSCFTEEYSVIKKDSNGMISMNSVEFSKLKHMFGFDHTKKITSSLEEASSDFLCGFLTGFFDCDGDVSKDSVRLGQSDLSRLEAIQRTLLRLGVGSTINLEKEAGMSLILGQECTTQTKYRLIICGSNIETFNSRIGFRHAAKKQKAEALFAKRQERKWLVTVKSVKPIEIKDVYCVTVPGIHHFDANGLFSKNCGGNMWVWHRKLATTNGEGLRLLKVATAKATVPANWRDYTKVVSGHRQKNLPKFIESQADTHHDIEDTFNELTGQRLRQPIDSEHKTVMSWLTENYPSAVWWDAEHHMLVTHTALLKECHTALGLRGKFETNASGTEKGFDINVFGFPIARGGWSLRRYTLGVAEHAYWQQDGAGWTSCFFNREPTLNQAASLFEGIEDTDGSYWFSSGERAQEAANLLGANLDLPPWARQLKCQLKIHKSGRLVATLEKAADSPHLANWLAKGKKLSRMFSIRSNPTGCETEVLRLDDQVRHMVSEACDDCGWGIKADGDWNMEPLSHVKLFLASIGHNAGQMTNVLGASISQPWRLVNLPFREEYPGKRQWNRKAAQLRFKPSLNRDSLSYPTWTRILNHVGKNLDEAIKANEWCKQHGVLTGADWLKCWVASLFQEPLEPLPYIFLYGPQNSGKSIFHEALELLMSKGVCRADQALISGGGFNGELEGKVLCIIEEVDLKKNVQAYNRIKDWVTSKLLPIHRKMEQPYMTPNTTHYVQCANTHLYCPVFPGDTRITMILVDSLEPTELIPKKQILPMLETEAPDFLAEILSVELPPSGDRLNVPCITTEDKTTAEYANQTLLEVFCVEKCFFAPGHKAKFSEFADKFHEWIDPNSVSQWSKIRIGKELPPKFVKARLPATGEFWIGNISFTQVVEADFGAKYISREGKLYQDESGQIKEKLGDNNSHLGHPPGSLDVSSSETTSVSIQPPG